MYGILLLLHVLSATVWTGGHLILSLAILPRAIREQSASELIRFESAYERIGMPSLLVQVATGLWLAHKMMPDASHWFALQDPISRGIFIKLTLLLATLVLAADARLRIIPRLSADRLTALAWHIVPVTVISVLFVIVGVSFRTGWLR